jgi:glycosyltransferase involved in cell wall biosynthesis
LAALPPDAIASDDAVHIAYLHYLAAGDSALTHVTEFARAARALGADIAVHAVKEPAGPAGAPPPATGRRLDRRLARYLHEPAELARNYALLARERAIVAARRPDVLLARVQLLTASYVLTARRARLPLVLEVNAPVLESETYQDHYAHLPWIPQALERWQLAAADEILVVSSPLRSYFMERYGLAADGITVVPNGADTGRFRPDVEPAVPRPAGEAPVVGFVGSFQEFHGIDLLSRVITSLAAARPQVRFLLVGDGRGADAVRAATAPLGPRVVFTGRVPYERVPGLVTSFDIGLLPDTGFHCCPLKVVEWMAAARAVVAPAYPCVTDLVSDGVDGLLFRPRDADALVAVLTRLVDAAELRARLGAAARARVERSLTWSDNARAVLAACERAARRRGAQPTSE